MKLLTVCKKDNYPECAGFSIVEIVILLGILALVLAGGIFINLDSLRSRNFLSEEKLLADLLWSARSRSLSNLGGVSHGVFIDEDKFVLFQGASFYDSEKSEEFLRGRNIEIKTDTNEQRFEIVFQNLTGKVLEPKNFTVSDGVRTTSFSVELEGRIN